MPLPGGAEAALLACGLLLLARHYILRGPPDCPYAGGEYWGVLIFRECVLLRMLVCDSASATKTYTSEQTRADSFPHLLVPPQAADYPFKPPGIKMYTPSGRFQVSE